MAARSFGSADRSLPGVHGVAGAAAGGESDSGLLRHSLRPPADLAKLSKMPSEYFRSNLFATYWFEKNQGKLPALFQAVGEDSIMFATDFPHPTCLYPRPVERAQETMAALSPEVRGKVLGETARKLYRL